MLGSIAVSVPTGFVQQPRVRHNPILTNEVNVMGVVELDFNANPGEKDLLLAGFSCAEVAARTGRKVKTVRERNRLAYRVDLKMAFAERVRREGIPNRYIAGDAFGWWFAGYFDGEGCLTVFHRVKPRPERRVGVSISCRYDDSHVLREIQKTLGVGICRDAPSHSLANPAFNWRVEPVADLAEVMLPLFDCYPLRTKKRHEYAIWRGLVVDQYLRTLGGRSTRVGASVEEHAAFQLAVEKIRQIRHMTGSR